MRTPASNGKPKSNFSATQSKDFGEIARSNGDFADDPKDEPGAGE